MRLSEALKAPAIVFQKHWRGRKKRLAWVGGEKLRREKFFANLAKSTLAQREAEFARRKLALAERARKKMLAERAEGNSHAHATIGNHGKKKGVDRSAELRDPPKTVAALSRGQKESAGGADNFAWTAPAQRCQIR